MSCNLLQHFHPEDRDSQCFFHTHRFHRYSCCRSISCFTSIGNWCNIERSSNPRCSHVLTHIQSTSLPRVSSPPSWQSGVPIHSISGAYIAQSSVILTLIMPNIHSNSFSNVAFNAARSGESRLKWLQFQPLLSFDSSSNAFIWHNILRQVRVLIILLAVECQLCPLTLPCTRILYLNSICLKSCYIQSVKNGAIQKFCYYSDSHLSHLTICCKGCYLM